MASITGCSIAVEFMEYCLYPSYTSKNLKISKNIFCDEANSLLIGFEVFIALLFELKFAEQLKFIFLFWGKAIILLPDRIC